MVNKVDKPGANCDKVVNAAFDLFDKLGANDEQLDFSGGLCLGHQWLEFDGGGAAGEQWGPDMSALFNTILKHVPANSGDPKAPLQLQISALDFSQLRWSYWCWPHQPGTIKPGMDVLVMEGPDGKPPGPHQPGSDIPGPGPHATPEAGPGDIVLINGIEDIGIGVTVTDPSNPQPLPMLKVDEPTLIANFCVNTSRWPVVRASSSPAARSGTACKRNAVQRGFAGEGNLEDGVFEVAGRGELHLTILLENMRREGYELAVGKPARGFKDIDGVRCRTHRDGDGRHRRTAPGRRDAGPGRA